MLNKSVQRLDRVALIAILAAMSYLLTLIAIPVIPVAPYLKLDLSDLPILVGTVILGIPGGIAITALKMLLHLVLVGFSITNLVGNLTSLIASVVLLITVSFLAKWSQRSKLRKGILVATETFNLVWIMALANLFITPLYVWMAGLHLNFSLTKLVIWGVIPFNLIKGILVGILFLPLYQALRKSRRFHLK